MRGDFAFATVTGTVGTVTVTSGTATAKSAIVSPSTAVTNDTSRRTSKGKGAGSTVGFRRAGEVAGSTVGFGRAGMGLGSWKRERSIDKVRNFILLDKNKQICPTYIFSIIIHTIKSAVELLNNAFRHSEEAVNEVAGSFEVGR